MFKQEIKSSLEEITLKNQEIAQLSSNNIDLSAAIENAKR